MLDPIAYSSRGAYVTPRWHRVLGVVSLLAGVASVIACVALIVLTLQGLRQTTQDMQRGNLRASEFRSEHDFAMSAVTVLVVMLLLGVLLLTAAVLLYRSNPRGLLLHRVYVALQLVASIALASITMAFIYDSPAGPVFFFGAIPGMIAAIYPVVLIILWWLRRNTPQTET